MSAPSIPNLLSLRGGRTGRGLGRGRGGGRGGSSVASQALSHDVVIQGTDTDAAVSRLSAVELGYLEDPFARSFVQPPSTFPQRRLPIINRGTYTRTTVLDSLVDAFLGPSQTPASSSPTRQVISLGAGTDTRSFRLFSRPDVYNVLYHELDFEPVTTKKLRTVQTTIPIRGVFPEVKVAEVGDNDIPCWNCETATGNQLWCHGLDLRRLASHDEGQPQVALKGLRDDMPTLLISECCLCYLEPAQAAGVIQWFTRRIQNLGIVIYEPTKPDDLFGRMMTSNLAARNIRMPTLDIFRQPADQESRLIAAGFEKAKQMAVDQIWDLWISPEEKDRVDSLEGLDEIEEWKLLAGHYVIAWGWRGSGFEDMESGV